MPSLPIPNKRSGIAHCHRRIRQRKVVSGTGGATGALPPSEERWSRVRALYHYRGATVVHRRRDRARPRCSHARTPESRRLSWCVVVGRPWLRSLHCDQLVGERTGDACERPRDTAGSRSGGPDLRRQPDGRRMGDRCPAPRPPLRSGCGRAGHLAHSAARPVRPGHRVLPRVGAAGDRGARRFLQREPDDRPHILAGGVVVNVRQPRGDGAQRGPGPVVTDRQASRPRRRPVRRRRVRTGHRPPAGTRAGLRFGAAATAASRPETHGSRAPQR